MEILRCPLCKGKLDLQAETENNQNVIKGTMICSACKRKYFVQESIPRMYVTDKEIIARSGSSDFSEFVVTEQNLDNWMNGSKTRFKSRFFLSRFVTIFMVAFGWILFVSALFLLVLSWLGFHVMIINSIPLYIYLLASSLCFFVIDFSSYRIGAKIEHSKELCALKKLCNERKLSEYDIRISNKDREDAFKNEFDFHRDFVAWKGKKIASILNEYSFSVITALNAGCGGALHESASKPYFDKGYNMIGVDVNEEYVKEFAEAFNTEGILANVMALPFESESFDLVNSTDNLEHLHDPFLGLKELWRVLRADGVIVLFTNNRGAITKRCANPFVISEKIIGLYCDKILPNRKMLQRWMNFGYYHTEFSKNEITKLMKAAGFEILSLETQFVPSRKITDIFQRIPVLGSMCGKFLIIGKKIEYGEMCAS